LQDANRDPRGVTVYTGDTAEHYKIGDDWYLDEKGNLHVVDVGGRRVALYFIGTALRAESGPYTPQ
jgi:hypothetical protein